MWLQWLRMRIHSKLAGFFLIDNSNNKLLGNYLLCDDPYGSCYPIFFLQWKVAKDARARGPQESQGEAGA